VPYTNVPEDLWGKMDSCVEQIMAERGYEKERAISICHAQIVKEKEMGEDKPKGLVDTFMGLLTGQTQKAGARHSRKDGENLQSIHDLAVGLGAECTGTMKVVKQADGRLRWVSFSSTAYRDRDGEIVSTKALADDVDRADATRDYGPLRFWHVPGLELGDCDYNALDGKVLIESGTFRDERYGEAFKNSSDEWGVSLGFLHPATEPDKEGVYNAIRRFERSPLPVSNSSNLFTQLSVKESNVMDIPKEKLDALEKLLGKEAAATLLKQAEGVQKQADAAGVAFKEGEKTQTLPAPEMPAAEKARKMADMMGDMDEEAYMAYMRKAFVPFIEKAIADAFAGAKKPDEKPQEKQAEADALAQVGVALKQVGDAQAALKALVESMQAEQKKTAEYVADLMGETPRAARGFRASQDDATLVQKDAPAFAGPVVDESFGKFVSGQR